MPKLRKIPDSELLEWLQLIPEQAQETDCDYTFNSGEVYELTDQEAFVLTTLRAGDLSNIAHLLRGDQPIPKIIRDALAHMIEDEEPFNDYLLVAVKNKTFEKNTMPERLKFLRKIGRLRVGYAIQVFGGLEKNMHEAAIAEARTQFDISRSAAEKIWKDYRELDEGSRHRFRGPWDVMCRNYDKIDFVQFLGR